jgi:putative redox protein
MSHVHAEIGKDRYSVRISAGLHHMAVEEPFVAGATTAGPTPNELLLASLAAFTAITLRMLADRVKWALATVNIDLRYQRERDKAKILRTLRFGGNLTREQRNQLADITERTPIILALQCGIPILTEIAPLRMTTELNSLLDRRLDEALEETFPASDPPAVTLAQERSRGVQSGCLRSALWPRPTIYAVKISTPAARRASRSGPSG